MKLSIILPIFAVVAVLAFFLSRAPASGFTPTATVRLDEHTVKVAVASTPLLQARGLSGVTELKRDEGMLFIFAAPDRYGFWMKDMRFPIDIVWFDENGVAVDFAQNVAPNSFPNVLRPSAPARFVLELPAGSVVRYGVVPGASRLGEPVPR